MKKLLSEQLDKLASAEEMLDFFEIPYNKKLLKSHKHQFLRHLKKHLENCNSMHNWNETFLYNYYKDLLVLEYNNVTKQKAA